MIFMDFGPWMFKPVRNDLWPLYCQASYFGFLKFGGGELQKCPGFSVFYLANYIFHAGTSSNSPGNIKLVLATSISAKVRFLNFIGQKPS